MKTPPRTESARALEAYHAYEGMGTARSTAKVARQLGKTKALMDRWSSAHGWVERARAHDEAIAQEAAAIDKAERLAEMERKRADRIKVAAAIRGKAIAALQQMNAAYLAERPDSVTRMFAHADTTERLDMGEATERIDVTRLSDDELAELIRRAAGGAGTPSAGGGANRGRNGLRVVNGDDA